MSWKDILKIDPERMMREPDRKPVRELEAPDSKVMDYEIAADIDVEGNCCEAARNAAVTVANSFLDHPMKDKIFMNVDKERTPDEIERFLLNIENTNCRTLRRWLREVGKIDKYPDGLPELKPHARAPKYRYMHNPIVVEFRKIWEEWEECESDVV